MAVVYISPEAQNDLHDIRKYIAMELGNPSAAANTVSKIMKGIQGLEVFPGIGTPLAPVVDISNEYRFLVCGSYLVFYRHDDSGVYVVRILYGRRDYTRILFGETQE
jgi:plasmid stabilization system protein ParE